MSARTIEEIRADVRLAVLQSDIAKLNSCHVELESFDISESHELGRYVQALIYGLQGDHSAAISIHSEQFALYQERGDLSNASMSANSLGILYYDLGDYETALEYFYRALAIREDIGAHMSRGGVLNNIAMIFAKMGDYAKALEYYHKALALHIEFDNRIFQANTTSNLGEVYGLMGNSDLALDHFQRSLTLQRELGNKSGTSSALGAIGAMHFKRGDYDEAERWAKQSIDYAVEHGLNRSLASHMNMLAHILVQTHRFNEATTLLDDNSELFERYPTVLTNTLTVRADICRARGEVDEARRLLLTALDQVTSRNERANVAEYCERLRDLAKSQGDFEAYITYNEQYLAVSNEVSGAESTRRIALQEKEREMEVVRAERERERVILYGALPQHIAERLIRGEEVTDHIGKASVIFVDIVGFTTISSTLTSQQVTTLIDAVFGVCDEVCQRNNVVKIKTIGDSYLAFGETANSK